MPAFNVNAKLTAVEWSSDYQHVRDWSTVAARLAYLQSLDTLPVTLQSNDLSQVRKGGVLKIATCETGETPTEGLPSLEQLEKINYIYFEQDGRTWFYFVDSVDYIGVRQARLNLTLDYWQTYYFDFTLEKCFVERGHVHDYTSSEETRLDPTYLLTPENIDVGDLLIPNRVRNVQQVDIENRMSNINEIYWAWVISTEVLYYTEGYPQAAGSWVTDTPFYIYTIPFCTNSKQKFEVVNDTNGEVLTTKTLRSFLDEAYKKNGTVSIFFTQQIFLPVKYEYVRIMPRGEKIVIHMPSLERTSRHLWQPLPSSVFTIQAYNNYSDVEHEFGLLHVDTLDMSIRSKVDCYPYHYYKLVSCRGYELIIKPQYCIKDTGEQSTKIYYELSILDKPKEGYAVDCYGDIPMSIMANNSINEYPLIRDAYQDYVQTGKNMERAGLISLGLQLGKGVIGGAAVTALGAATGNAFAEMGGGAGMVGSVISFADKMQQHFAKIQDLKDTPDTVRSIGNDYIFEIIAGTLGCQIYEYYLPQAQIQRAINYFGRMGYTIKDVIKYDTRSKQYYNYVQTVEAAIVGNIPTDAKRQIRAIFDNGVTIWHEGSTMYDYKPIQADVWA